MKTTINSKRIIAFIFLLYMLSFMSSIKAYEPQKTALVFTAGNIVGDSITWLDLLTSLNIEADINDYTADFFDYDLLILDEYSWPSPDKIPALKCYFDGGGNLVLTGGTPLFLAGSINLDTISNIIGATNYHNSQGDVIVEDDMPFDLNYHSGQILYNWAGGSFGALSGLTDSCSRRIYWSSGGYNSFFHQYNLGQSYFTASAFADESTTKILKSAIKCMVYDICGVSKNAIIAIDRSGSMALSNPLGQTRLERAKNMAHIDIGKLLDPADIDFPFVCNIAVMYFNSDGIILSQDFTDDATVLHNAIDAISRPRHDTPLAAAMCNAIDLIPLNGYLITYTDGLENASQYFDVCPICDSCFQLMYTGWNYNCDPDNPSSCSDWQMCLFTIFSNHGTTLVHYFGEPITPFVKGRASEDMYFLKATAEGSDGLFFYHSDSETICGDANSDGAANISDAVYILEYIFSDGDAPIWYSAGDVNCDDVINVSDAVYIINFVFVNGPDPCESCR